MVAVTLLYAGVLGLLMAVLSIRVPMRRGALDVPYGDGEDTSLRTRIRAFGNFIEYVPMVLVLMALLELEQIGATWLHGLGATLVGARLLHALTYRGKCQLDANEKIGRAVSAMSTWMVLVAAAGLCVWVAAGG